MYQIFLFKPSQVIDSQKNCNKTWWVSWLSYSTVGFHIHFDGCCAKKAEHQFNNRIKLFEIFFRYSFTLFTLPRFLSSGSFLLPNTAFISCQKFSIPLGCGILLKRIKFNTVILFLVVIPIFFSVTSKPNAKSNALSRCGNIEIKLEVVYRKVFWGFVKALDECEVFPSTVSHL